LNIVLLRLVLILLAVFRGCDPDIFLENITEIMRIVIAGFTRDLRALEIRAAQQFLGLI